MNEESTQPIGDKELTEFEEATSKSDTNCHRLISEVRRLRKELERQTNIMAEMDYYIANLEQELEDLRG